MYCRVRYAYSTMQVLQIDFAETGRAGERVAFVGSVEFRREVSHASDDQRITLFGRDYLFFWGGVHGRRESVGESRHELCHRI